MSESETSGPAESGPTGPPPSDAGATATAPPPPSAAPAPRRRLTRSRDDRVIAGVCGGLAEHLDVDPVIVRIAALILLFVGGAGLLLYVIGWIAIPEAPAVPATAGAAVAAPPAPGEGERTSGALALGLLFVGLGVVFLLDKVFPDALDWQWIWPIGLIVLGAIVILRARR